MIGATEILKSTDKPGKARLFVVLFGVSASDHYRFHRVGSDDYTVQARVTEGASPKFVDVLSGDSDHVTGSLSTGVVHRVNPVKPGSSVHLATATGAVEIMFAPHVKTATRRTAQLAPKAVKQIDITRDFDLDDNLPVQWSATTSNGEHATVTVDPVTGVMTVTGVAEGKATVKLTATNKRFKLSASKTVSVTVT